MRGLGSGDNGEFTFLDTLSIISFCIALENLGMNISQTDLQEHTENLDKALRDNVEEIHRHLTVQDKKIDNILRIMQENGGVVKNDSRRDI